jgi:hypothetical protein
MLQAISVRDVSTPGNGRRVLEVTIGGRESGDLMVRVVVGAPGRSSEALLAAALATEVAERVVDPALPAAIEISVPDRPGPAKVPQLPPASPL